MFVTRRFIKPLLFSPQRISRTHILTTVKTTFSLLSIDMSTNPTNTPPPEISKIADKKQAAKRTDPLAGKYGDMGLYGYGEPTGRIWTDMRALRHELKDKEVLIGGRILALHAVSKKTVFLVLHAEGSTVQCVVTVNPDLVCEEMVEYTKNLSLGSIVDVVGVVSVPLEPLMSTTQQVINLGRFVQVEIQVRKIYCVSRALKVAPYIEEINSEYRSMQLQWKDEINLTE